MKIANFKQIKRKITVLIILFCFLFLVLNLFFAMGAKSKIESYRCEDGGYKTYSRSNDRSFYCYKVTFESFYGSGCSEHITDPMNIPWSSFSSATIKVYDENNTELAYTYEGNTKVFICYSRDMAIALTVPYYSWIYEVNIYIQYYRISLASLYSFIGCFAMILLGTILIVRFESKTILEGPALEELTLEEQRNSRLKNQRSFNSEVGYVETIYDDSLNNQIAICAICKLEIRNTQVILICNYCQSLFHKNHLKQWLQTTRECPVCKRIIGKDNVTIEEY